MINKTIYNYIYNYSIFDNLININKSKIILLYYIVHQLESHIEEIQRTGYIFKENLSSHCI